jgi:hypothetical protein
MLTESEENVCGKVDRDGCMFGLDSGVDEAPKLLGKNEWFREMAEVA